MRERQGREGVEEVAIFGAVSESFGQANIECSIF